MRKPPQIGQLTALPQDQKDLLEEWLETTTPYPQLAQRVLDEFGVQTNKSQLIRMRAHFHAKRAELKPPIISKPSANSWTRVPSPILNTNPSP